MERLKRSCYKRRSRWPSFKEDRRQYPTRVINSTGRAKRHAASSVYLVSVMMPIINGRANDALKRGGLSATLETEKLSSVHEDSGLSGQAGEERLYR